MSPSFPEIFLPILAVVLMATFAGALGLALGVQRDRWWRRHHDIYIDHPELGDPPDARDHA